MKNFLLHSRSLYSLRHHHKISSYSLPSYVVRRLIRYRREIRASREAQWQEFCFQLEPKNTDYFWRHTKRLFHRIKPQLQGFIDPHTTIHHAFDYYSHTFMEIDSTFKTSLLDKLTDLPSQPLSFTINDFIQSSRRS